MARYNKTHGMTGTRTYNIWCGMLQRCNNPNRREWFRYGGRGICVDEKWESFDGFLKDMGECPDKLTLDRINNDGNYCKDNCHWVSYSEQSRNNSNVVKVTINGETKCLKDWANVFGNSYANIGARLKLGWPPIRSITFVYQGTKRRSRRMRFLNKYK